MPCLYVRLLYLKASAIHVLDALCIGHSTQHAISHASMQPVHAQDLDYSWTVLRLQTPPAPLPWCMCSWLILSKRERETERQREWKADKAGLSAWPALCLKWAMWLYAKARKKWGRSVLKQACFMIAKEVIPPQLKSREDTTTLDEDRQSSTDRKLQIYKLITSKGRWTNYTCVMWMQVLENHLVLMQNIFMNVHILSRLGNHLSFLKKE